jgi:hypothetical protein
MSRSWTTRRAHARSLLRRLGAIAAVCVMPGLAGCGSDTSAERERGAAVSTATPRDAASVAPPSSARRETSRSRGAGAPRAPAAAAGFEKCDPNISVRAATTTCGFAQNVFYEFFIEGVLFEPNNAIRAYSPVSRQDYAVSCTTDEDDRVRCVAGDGGEVRFSLAALLAYDDEQADRYASTHDLGPNRADAPSRGNGPDEERAALPEDRRPTTGPDLGHGDEIPNYDEGRGYRVRCADGMYSRSGGIQGACSGHGGVAGGPPSSDSAPSYGGTSPSGGGTVHVDGYYRKDGTYVRPHTRRAPCSYC